MTSSIGYSYPWPKQWNHYQSHRGDMGGVSRLLSIIRIHNGNLLMLTEIRWILKITNMLHDSPLIPRLFKEVVL